MPNSPSYFCTAPRGECGGQLKRQLLQFARRTAMDIEGLGEAIVDQLVDADLVEVAPRPLPPDQGGPAQGPTAKDAKKASGKWADNLLDGIAASKDRGLARLLSGIGVPMVADSMADVLAQAVPVDGRSQGRDRRATLASRGHRPGAGEGDPTTTSSSRRRAT